MNWGLPALAMLLVGTAAAGTTTTPVQLVTLKNGVRVALAPDPQAAAADVAVWYAMGPRLEPAGRSGMTHLFERLLFRGTASEAAGEYRRRLQAEGAVVNTFTSPDFTSLFATLPPSGIPLALELDAARMTQLRITPAELEQERGVMQRETQLLADNPIGFGMQRLYATAFPDHGYGRPVVGTPEDISRITLDDVNAWYRDRYAPNTALVTVVGRFDPATVMPALRKSLEALPRRGTAAPKPAPPAPPRRRAYERIAGRSPMLFVGWRAPRATDPDGAALEMLARVLGSGSQGRFSRDLSSNPTFSQASAGYDPRQDGSLFYAFAAVRSQADTATAEQTLVGAVEKLGEEPISPQELDRAKRDYELAILADLQTVRGRARALGTALLVDGKPDATERRLDAIRNLTVDDVKAAAGRVFADRNRSVVWLWTQAPGLKHTGGVR